LQALQGRLEWGKRGGEGEMRVVGEKKIEDLKAKWLASPFSFFFFFSFFIFYLFSFLIFGFSATSGQVWGISGCYLLFFLMLLF
jgi:hypothetical protein